MEKEELIEIKCLGCGRPRWVLPKTTIAFLCPNCCKELEQKINSKNLKNSDNSDIL